MNMKSEIKAYLLSSLARNLDAYMQERGFSRSKQSTTYKRALNNSKQIIKIEVELHPNDNRNASAALYPQMEVLVPDVDIVLGEMTQGHPHLLDGVTSGVARQPIGITSKKAHDGRWFLYQPDSVDEAVLGIRQFMDQWALPFLDTYSTAGELVAADQRDDERVMRDRPQILRVAAAALVCGQKEYALAILEKWLGSTGARRAYAPAFDFVAR